MEQGSLYLDIKDSILHIFINGLLQLYFLFIWVAHKEHFDFLRCKRNHGLNYFFVTFFMMRAIH